MEDLIKLIETEAGWKASVGEGTADEIVKEAGDDLSALRELVVAMATVLSGASKIPGGWVGGRPNDR